MNSSKTFVPCSIACQRSEVAWLAGFAEFGAEFAEIDEFAMAPSRMMKRITDVILVNWWTK